MVLLFLCVGPKTPIMDNMKCDGFSALFSHFSHSSDFFYFSSALVRAFDVLRSCARYVHSYACDNAYMCLIFPALPR